MHAAILPLKYFPGKDGFLNSCKESGRQILYPFFKKKRSMKTEVGGKDIDSSARAPEVQNGNFVMRLVLIFCQFLSV